MNRSNSKYFKSHLIHEKDRHMIQGDIYEFDKKKGRGHFTVFPDQAIPQGDYRFHTSNVLRKNLAFVEGMKAGVVTVTVSVMYETHISGNRKIQFLILSDLSLK